MNIFFVMFNISKPIKKDTLFEVIDTVVKARQNA